VKVTLTLERPDVEEMIKAYFNNKGFQPENLEQLCDMFLRTYPEGFNVVATVASVPSKQAAPLEQRVYVEDSPSTANPELTYGDLQDPTYLGINSESVARQDIENILAEAQQLPAAPVKGPQHE